MASRIAVRSVLGGTAIVIAFPFYWMAISTVRPEKEVYTVALNLLPSTLSFAMSYLTFHATSPESVA